MDRLKTHIFAQGDLERALFHANELRKVDAQEKEIMTCQHDPYWFMTGHCYTIDEKDKKQNCKRFPPKEHLRYVLYRAMTEPLLAVIKSRQLMLSWLFCELFLWDILFHSGRKAAIHSLNEEKSQAFIKERIFHSYYYLPAFMKDPAVQEEKDISAKRMRLARTNSQVMALPSGNDALVSYVISKLYEDEAQDQKNLEEGLVKAQPAIISDEIAEDPSNSGQIFLVGTAEEGEYWNIIHRLPDGEGKAKTEKALKQCAGDFWATYDYDVEKARKAVEGTFISIPMRGIREWRNSQGYLVLEIHYCSDDNKNPVTEHGLRWQQKVKSMNTSWGWRKEYEIDPGAGGGKRVFPDFSRKDHCIKAEDFIFNDKYPILVGLDFGYHYPAATLNQVDEEGWITQFDEFTRSDLRTFRFAEELRLHITNNYMPNREFDPNRIFIWCDDHGSAVHHDADQTSIETIWGVFGKEPFHERSKDAERIELLSYFMDQTGLGKPGYRIVEERCPQTIAGYLGRLVYHPMKRDQPKEVHYDIDLLDAEGYFMYGITVDRTRKIIHPPGSAYITPMSREEEDIEDMRGDRGSGNDISVGEY